MDSETPQLTTLTFTDQERRVIFAALLLVAMDKEQLDDNKAGMLVALAGRVLPMGEL